MTSPLKQLDTPPAPPKSDTMEVCIDLPGETVRCWRRQGTKKVRVMLRKHHDVIFDLNLKSGNSYTVEADTSDFYNARDKKLVEHKLRQTVSFKDGERLHLWVGREFKGNLILKSQGKEISRYPIDQLDPTLYDHDPKTKPEPLLIAIGKSSASTEPAGQCTPEDPYGIANSHEAQKALIQTWLKGMQNHGTQLDYLRYTQPREITPQETEYVVVTTAEAKEIQPQVLAQLDKGQPVQDTPEKIFAPITAASVLTVAADKFGETLAQNAWKETAGYAQEHWKQFSKLGMKVYVERAPLGKYRVVFKGRMLTRVAGQAATTAAGWALKDKVIRKPMGAPSSAWLDGSYGKTGKTGMGGAKRITITAASNFKTGMKIQMIDTIIDLYGDTVKVFGKSDDGKEGSKDISEFLGRAGVTVAKAGATAALGSLIAVGITAVLSVVAAALFSAATAPVWIVVGLVIIGYIFAATIVDLVDESFQIKERAAVATR